MHPWKSKMSCKRSTKKACSNEPRRMKLMVSPAGLYLLVDLSQGIWSWHVLSVESRDLRRNIFSHFPAGQWPPCEPRPKEVMERTVAWNDVGVLELHLKISESIWKSSLQDFTGLFSCFNTMWAPGDKTADCIVQVKNGTTQNSSCLVLDMAGWACLAGFCWEGSWAKGQRWGFQTSPRKCWLFLYKFHLNPPFLGEHYFLNVVTYGAITVAIFRVLCMGGYLHR